MGPQKFRNCKQWLNQWSAERGSSLTHIISIYFEIVHFFHAQLGLDVLPRYEVSLHIPEHSPEHSANRAVSYHTHTHTPSLHAPTCLPYHLHISTGRHPTLTFQMPKPSQSATPHHLSHTLNTQKTTKPHFAFFPSSTLHISTSPSYAPLFPDCRFSSFIAHVWVPYVNKHL